MKRSKILQILIDFIILYVTVYCFTEWIGLGTEEVSKKLILVVSTIFYSDLFGFYDRKGLAKNELLFSLSMVIFFTFITSVFITFIFYFTVLGRKIYISYFIVLFAYIFIKNKLNLIYPLKLRYFSLGCDELLTKYDIKEFYSFDENQVYSANDVIILNDMSKLPEEVSINILKLKLSGITVVPLSKFIEKRFDKIPIEFYEDLNRLIFLDGFDRIKSKSERAIKRVFDVVFSFLLLILTSPILFLVSIAIKLDSKGPVFFKQRRTGEHNIPFMIYKFRSMYVDAEKFGAKWAEKDDPRITRVGKFIRKTRIDELPQLINILKGEMSFVGPRPERPEFDEMLSKEIPFWMLRYLVKPGLTGWAQINYDYGASIEDSREKLKYDLFYIKNFSLYLDLKIIFKTLKVIFFGKGR